MLEASHLVKRFFGVTVVGDVSFVVRPGEVVGSARRTKTDVGAACAK
jgi:ABC-type branched-subunit amino acid transport system ATPase component